MLNLLLLFILFSNCPDAKAQKAIYTTRGGISLGLGAGASYQQSDIANSRGTALDFTFGTPLYQRENAFLSVDWKFRLLAGENKAFDHRINTDGTYSNLDYKFSSYDLELGLTLNRLRERTRIVISGFAGAGLTHGRTFTDLRDENNSPYDYSSIDPNRARKQVYQDLLNLSDNDFETRLTNKTSIFPTAGLYIGYQFSRSFSLGFEHKTSFSLTEENSATGINMDNRIVSGSRMDMNHYTAVCFRWSLGSAGHSGSGTSQALLPDTPAVLTGPVTPVNPDPHDTPAVTSPPAVKITEPGTDPYHSPSGFITVRADIRNAGGSENIRFFQDGEQNNRFTYNSYTRTFSANVNLHQGDNNLRIHVQNQAGNAEDRIRVIVDGRETRMNAPTVRFIYPEPTEFRSERQRLDVSARVGNVTGKTDILVRLNGRSVDFTFQPGTGTVNVPVGLNEGMNSLSVSAKNLSGSASDERRIIYSAPVVMPLPVITFLNPGSPVAVSENVFTLRALVRNVSSPNDVTLSVNGSYTGNFSFNGSGEVSAYLNLREGDNSVEITARNEAGSHSERTAIRFVKPIRKDPPVIHLLVPATSPWKTSETTTELHASIEHIEAVDGITFTINGSNSRNFSFRPSAGDFTSQVPLLQDRNTVTITARNEAGSDAASVIIIREERPCPAPVILSSGNGPDQLTSTEQSFFFSSPVRNIGNRNQLKLSLNGISVPFEFNGREVTQNIAVKTGYEYHPADRPK